VGHIGFFAKKRGLPPELQEQRLSKNQAPLGAEPDLREKCQIIIGRKTTITE
jgi:hypothetical protein